jgi:hypothetical protein
LIFLNLRRERILRKRLILVKEKDERVLVSVKTDGESPVGLLVMSPDGDAASFVNITGTIDLSRIGNLGVDLDQSVIDSPKAHTGTRD